MRFRPAWLLLLPVAAVALGFPLFQRAAEDIPPPRPGIGADAIVVLTGGPGRIEAGLRLLGDGAAPVLIVSGVGRRIEMADIARLAGTTAESLAPRVHLGRAAASTRGNAVEIAAWAEARGARRLLVVTAGFHLPRALLELRRTLPEAELIPVPVRGQRVRPEAWLREYAKYLGALAGLSALLPAREEARLR
ncbi:MAG: YdcF family protein [Acetobacteraceae bacterium]|nr:YdcF family protein [Acetobacteraceae bacterium]MDW8399438.1 YdcF family protein [Acetobacteraceae bacterium]